jgi:hypothetical protein
MLGSNGSNRRHWRLPELERGATAFGRRRIAEQWARVLERFRAHIQDAPSTTTEDPNGRAT